MQNSADIINSRTTFHMEDTETDLLLVLVQVIARGLELSHIGLTEKVIHYFDTSF